MHPLYSRAIDLWQESKARNRAHNPCADIFRELLHREMPTGDIRDQNYIPPSSCSELCEIIAKESGELQPFTVFDQQEISRVFAQMAARRERRLPFRDTPINRLRFQSPIVVSLTMSSYSRRHGDFGIGIGVFSFDEGVSIGLFGREVDDGVIQLRYEKLIAFIGPEEGDVKMTRVHRGWLSSTFSVVDPLGELEMEVRGTNKGADILHDALSGRFTL